MAAFTLAQLVAKARTRANMVGSTFIIDADVEEFINSAYTELYEALVETFEDYFISSTTIATTNNQDTYSLTGLGVFKLRGLDILISSTPGNFIPLESYEFGERDKYIGVGLGVGAFTVNGERLKYRLSGRNLVFAPVPDGAYNIKVWFVPNATILDHSVPGTSDILPEEIRPGWEEWIVCEAAIQMLGKEQNQHVLFLQGKKEKIEKRIARVATNRDAEAPRRMIRRSFRRWGYQGVADDGEMD